MGNGNPREMDFHKKRKEQWGVALLPETAMHNEKLIVEYARRKTNQRPHRFDLELEHVADNIISFTLFAEKRSNGKWVPLLAEIDPEETTANFNDALADLSDIWWHIVPRKERGRILLPIVALWEIGDIVLVACLSERYGGKRLSLAKQEQWFADDVDEVESPLPDPGRQLCWWPDSGAWEIARQAVQLQNSTPLSGVDLAFFTFDEWSMRPDIARQLEKEAAEYLAVLTKAGDDTGDPNIYEEMLADIQVEEYARYVRRVRTMLLYCREKGVPVNIRLGDNRSSSAFFAKNRLDPHDPAAWAEVASSFPLMPDFFIENVGRPAPLHLVAARQSAKAVLFFASHWPGDFMLDAVGAAIFVGEKRVACLVAWFNPLSELVAFDDAVEALSAELALRGVREISVADDVLPIGTTPSPDRDLRN